MLDDYVKMQGLRLPRDEVRVAQLAAEAVMAGGQSAVEYGVLWHMQEDWRLADYIEQDDTRGTALKQVFMALDSAWTRDERAVSAVVYVYTADDVLVRVAQQGKVGVQRLTVDAASVECSLAARAAQTGWLSVADDVAAWLASGSLGGMHHSGAQLAAPVCSESGAVFGVLYVEAAQAGAFDETAQAAWVGLAVALAAPLMLLSDRTDGGADDE
ncbi:hypothetical protein [Neisseria leonii]|uniref:hypothetical protein n=1 Tax=Neisseria leonii TaxID=2995413 RepID=UPI00237AC2F4|nr:hypothetical protein [Neisseria sp. 3986]MDD9326070.1 hypothetical protein [Neisseria sp. 3986]